MNRTSFQKEATNGSFLFSLVFTSQSHIQMDKRTTYSGSTQLAKDIGLLISEEIVPYTEFYGYAPNLGLSSRRWFKNFTGIKFLLLLKNLMFGPFAVLSIHKE